MHTRADNPTYEHAEGLLAALEVAGCAPGRTRLVWVETPANPMWEITDLAAVCELAHAAGVRVAVDNTVATAVHTRPLELGADLVVHSATEYLTATATCWPVRC